jgi:hypothetical protein
MLEGALDASKGVGRIINTGMKSPMNFCMGLARGFRNAPKLYNDETVRPEERVTSFGTGLKVAGKEFGLGFYDGLAGLVTQPLKGAEKEGGIGLLKGFGKGIGGLVLKPAAGIWALPAYTMQGVHAEVRNLFSRSSVNYIISSRVKEGAEQLDGATVEEQGDIVARWQTHKSDLKAFYQRQKASKDNVQLDADAPVDESAAGPPKTGWFHTRNLSFDERKKLQEQKEAWKKRQAAGVHSSGGSSTSFLEDEEMEQAILASVKQTSRGNPEEDAKVEQAIRASVREMRRIAEQSRELDGGISQSSTATSLPSEDDDIRNITDEEYQGLIEEAVRQSLAAEQIRQSQHVDGDDDEDLRMAIEQSRTAQDAPAEDHEAELRRVIEQSEKEHREQLHRQKTEEDIVLEYVKKQSLAEEEFRKSKLKGKAVGSSQDDADEEDEDLKRALEESLQMSADGPGGPSLSSRHP